MISPTDPKACMVLNDGETYTTLQDCTIVQADFAAMDRDGVDPDLEIAHAVKQGWYSKYVKIVTRFS